MRAVKTVLHVVSGKSTPDGTKPGHGLYVAWAELGDVQITGQLAAHTDRDVAEHQAAVELARRLRRLLRDPDVPEKDRPRADEPHAADD